MTHTSSVSRSLYRALLKLANKRKFFPHVPLIGGAHYLDLDNRFVKFLPGTIISIPTHDPNVNQIRFQELSQLREVVRINFRLNPASSEAIDAGFHAYRSTVQLFRQLEELQGQREMNQRLDILQYRKFKIGQVVEHKDFHYRGLVVGWEIDTVLKLQILSILWDRNDLCSNRNDDRDASQEELQDVCQVMDHVVQPLRAAQYFAVDHEHVNKYFYGYNPVLKRYLPKPSLQYCYPNDYTDEDLRRTYETLFTDQKYQHETTFFRLLQPLVVSISRQMVSLWNDYFPDHQHLMLTSIFPTTNVRSQYSVSFEKQLQTHELTITFTPLMRRLKSIHDVSTQIAAYSIMASSSFMRSWQQQIDDYYQFQELTLTVLNLQYELYEYLIELLHEKYAARCSDLTSLYALQLERPETVSPFVSPASATSNGSLWTLQSFPIPLAPELHQFIHEKYSLPFPQYQIGEVVYHSKYDYLALITAVEVKPTVPASLLLRSEESTTEQPYYRLFPDCMAGLPSLPEEERFAHPFYYAPEEQIQRVDPHSPAFQTFREANLSFTNGVLMTDREQLFADLQSALEKSHSAEERAEYLERWKFMLQIRYLRDALPLPSTKTIQTVNRSLLSFPQRMDLFLLELKQLLHYSLLSLPNQLVQQGLTPVLSETKSVSMQQLLYPLLRTAATSSLRERLQRINQTALGRFPVTLNPSSTNNSYNNKYHVMSTRMIINQQFIPFQLGLNLGRLAIKQDRMNTAIDLTAAMIRHFQEKSIAAKKEVAHDYSELIRNLQLYHISQQLSELILHDNDQLLELQTQLEAIVAELNSSSSSSHELSALVKLSRVLRMLKKEKEALAIDQKILEIQPFSPVVYPDALVASHETSQDLKNE